MKEWDEIKGVMWLEKWPLTDARSGKLKLPSGVDCSVVAGRNEEGWEHVSIALYAKRLPRWDEMCYIKDLFWNEDEEVVQIHPKKSEYVNIAEALHLWRPKDGDWAIMGRDEE